eukprot:1030025-Prymnesium_polylepis.3
MHSACFARSASVKGVSPLLFLASAEKPLRSRYLSTSADPWLAAVWRSVDPSLVSSSSTWHLADQPHRSPPHARRHTVLPVAAAQCARRVLSSACKAASLSNQAPNSACGCRCNADTYSSMDTAASSSLCERPRRTYRATSWFSSRHFGCRLAEIVEWSSRERRTS